MKRRPNILFFFPDQHRGDWLGSNPGLPLRTPNIDALAARGTRFTDCYCTSPLCAPSRASLASGRSYDRCGVVNNRDDYPLDQPTYYQALREAGYRVAGVGKFDLHKATLDWNLDGSRLTAEWGFTEGVDSEGKLDGSTSYRRSGGPKGPYLAFLAERGLADTYVKEHAERKRHRGAYTTELPDDAYGDNWVAENGLRLLRAFPEGRPWHLVVNFPGPHAPMDVTASMREGWKDVRFPRPHANDQPDYSEEDHQRNRQNYAAMVENIDRWVGRFVDAVEERGELADTLVVYSSDHGEMLGDHGRWGKSTWYQPSVNVPLVIAGPGAREGVVSDALVSLHDLATTFLEHAGAATPPEADAVSLRPLLTYVWQGGSYVRQGGSAPPAPPRQHDRRDMPASSDVIGEAAVSRSRYLTGETAKYRDHVTAGLGDWRMAFDGRHKLVVRPGGSAGDSPILFDLEADPWEDRNVAAERPEVVERLLALIKTEREERKNA